MQKKQEEEKQNNSSKDDLSKQKIGDYIIGF